MNRGLPVKRIVSLIVAAFLWIQCAYAVQMIAIQSIPHNISKIIANDLSSSGRFKVFVYTHVGQSSGAQYDLLGGISASRYGRFDLSFKLLNAQRHTLLTQQFANVPDAQLSSLAHRMSDLVFHKLTGIRGIFSTSLAYVAAQERPGSPTIYRVYVANADGSNPQLLLQQIGIPVASLTWSPDGQNIAYVSYDNGDMAIYSINVATGIRTRIADYPGIDSAPAYSPDGSEMAMALSMGHDDTNIYIMDLATHKLTQLTHFGNNTSPVWAPDSNSLIFVSNRDGTPQLYALNLQNGQLYRLTYSGVQNFQPVFTPDGKHLVLMHQKTTSGPIVIAAYNMQTGHMQTLTQGPIDKSPTVSPNSDMVAYTQYGRGNGVLALTNITGTIHVVLPTMAGSIQSPAWSPFFN